jgi:hypothetical protein
MTGHRERLLASEPAARAAKDAFASLYVLGRDDRAVGLGLNESGDEWAVKVFVHSKAAATEIPDHFRNFEVDVEVTGPATLR